MRGDRIAEHAELTKAQDYAKQSGDRPFYFWCLFRQLVSRADAAPVGAFDHDLRALLNRVLDIGDYRLAAAVHLTAADHRALAGKVREASRHIRQARSLLQRQEQLWLLTWAGTSEAAIAAIEEDWDKAVEIGSLTLSIANQCGSAQALVVLLANLGFSRLMRGDSTGAQVDLQNALDIPAITTSQRSGILDSLARLSLQDSDLQSCLRHVASAVHAASGDYLASVDGYGARRCLLTKADCISVSGQTQEALRAYSQVIEIALKAGDRPLLWDAHFSASALGSDQTLIAERALWSGGLKEFRPTWAQWNTRSRTSSLHTRRSTAAVDDGTAAGTATERPLTLLEHSSYDSYRDESKLTAVVESIASALLHPELDLPTARSLFLLTTELDCANSVRVRLATEDGRTLLEMQEGKQLSGHDVRTFCLGRQSGSTLEVTLIPKADLQSLRLCNSIMCLASAICTLCSAPEPSERLESLWYDADSLIADESTIVSQRMQGVLAYARRVAETGIGVLITGESGTGKEVLARSLHEMSPRSKENFITVNCAAIPRDLLESHLFGYRRGAFTGADRDNPGLLMAANGGTLFLDEIGDLSAELQPKLLRFLECGEISPIGGVAPLNLDVRILAATNVNLEEGVRKGTFREDLYYRLNVVSIELPPLRERRDEIPALARKFAEQATVEFHKGKVILSDELIESLKLSAWPGNIRQLRNEIRRMVALCSFDETLEPSSLTDSRPRSVCVTSPSDNSSVSIDLNETLPGAVEQIERHMITQALLQNRGDLESAANALGISRKGLYLKRQRYGL